MGLWNSFVKPLYNAVKEAVHDIVHTIVEIIVDIVVNVVEAVFSVLGVTDEDVTVVQASTNRLITDPQAFSLIRPVLLSIMEDREMMPLIQENELSCVRASVRNYLNYGKSDYVHGLPTTSSAAISTFQAEIDAALLDVTGYACTSTNVHIGTPYTTKWALYYLQENNSYSSTTNEFIYLGATVEFYSATIDVSNDIIITYQYQEFTVVETFEDVLIETVDGTETTTTTPGVTTTITNPFGVTVDTVYGTPVITTQPGDGSNDGFWHNIISTVPSETTKYDVMPLISPPLPEAYYTVDYYINTAPTVSLIWIYKVSDGTYPDLDQVTGGTDTTQAFPIVPLRSGAISVNSDTGSQTYITSRKIMAKIGLDIDDYINQLETNPNIADIDDAFILFAMNIYTTSNAGIQYWFNFFDVIRSLSDVSYEEYIAAGDRTDKPFNLHTITEQKYNSALKYDYIRHRIITGVIGDVGVYTKTITVLPKTEANEIQSYVTVRNQINATEYEEMIVHGLILCIAIFDDFNQVKIKAIELTDTPDEFSDFVFPISYTILDYYPSDDKEIIIYESLCMTVYAAQTIHLEWYQTTGFADILQIISVVIFFYTGYDLYSSIGKAFLSHLGKQILIQYVLQYALKKLLVAAGDNVGAQAAAIALYIYASFTLGRTKKFDFISIDSLLLSVNSVTSALSAKLTHEGNLLSKEMEAFDLAAKSKQEQIDEVNSGLYRHEGIDPYNISMVLAHNFYESPPNFYERTAHTTNMADIVLQQPYNFVSNALTLPEYTGNLPT